VRTVEKVRKALGGKFLQDVLEHVCATVWFISSQEDAWALTFRGAELKERHLIFLSDDLLRQDEGQIQFTILHEVGHVVLNHRNSIGYEQTQTEIRLQEIEADRFAKQFLNSPPKS